MGDNPEITHDGKVVKIEKGKFLVKITSRSACDACRARNICSAANMAEKHIEVISEQDLQIGDEVKVIMQEKLGLTAIFYAFFLPFLVMIFVLFVSLALGSSEISAALFAIVSLIPYYSLLHLSRKNIEKKFIFKAIENTI